MTEVNPGSAGWAAFEARMRNRRFARCIERAATGLESGAMEEVRDALDEARILCPDAPEIAEFESRFAALPSPSAVLLASNMSVQEPPAGWLRVVGAMCVLVLLFGLFGFGLAQLYFNVPMALLTDAVSQMAPASTAPSASPAPQPSAQDPAATAPRQQAEHQPQPEAQPEPQPETQPKAATNAEASRAVGTTSPPTPASPMALADTREGVERPMRRDKPSSSMPATRPAVKPSAPPTAPEPPRPSPERAAVAPDPPAALPAVSHASSTPVTDPVLPLESPTLSPSAAPPRAVPASSRDAVPASSRDAVPSAREAASAEIRLLLSRYETAYNRLDATAASSVWPGVDRTALDRAFKGLISQKVSLGLCDITVIGDIGGASCAGKARWEPRVGGGLQTADRYWTFNLRKGSEGWRIEQIRVR
jgi:hypothetical protein